MHIILSGTIGRLHLRDKLDVVVSQKNGKEVTCTATPESRACVQRYREIRKSCPIDALNGR